MEKLLTFIGGVHPPDFKEFTQNEDIKVIWPKVGQDVVFPMQQHIGAPAKPIVEVGDYVAIGQKIGEAGGFISASIHASVSGTVKEIKNVLTPTGITTQAVVITYDGLNKESLDINKPFDYKNMSKEEILNVIKEAGIVGLGGAGFPSHVKLNPPPDKTVDTIIMNAAECEPFLTTDYRVLMEETDVIIEGMKILLHLHPQTKGVIAIEDNKPKALEKMREKLKNEDRISLARLHTKYPQGAEKQLILAVTGREVPSGGLPADAGVIVHNVDTVIAIERAFLRGRPLMRKVVTITGDAVKNPGNYKVRIGMLHSDLIEAIGGFKEEPYKIISGGPMMGVSMFTLDVPLIKTSSGVICLTEKMAKLPEENNCIRCAKCVNHCPMGLMPQELNRNVLWAEYDEFKKNNGMDCIECGICSFVCPAKRHLTQSIRAVRRDVLAKKI